MSQKRVLSLKCKPERFAAFLFIFALSCSPNRRADFAPVVARVCDEAIRSTDLKNDFFWHGIFLADADSRWVAARKLLQMRIDESILVCAAKKAMIRVSPIEVDLALNRFSKRLDLVEEHSVQSQKFRDQIHRRLLVERYIASRQSQSPGFDYKNLLADLKKSLPWAIDQKEFSSIVRLSG